MHYIRVCTVKKPFSKAEIQDSPQILAIFEQSNRQNCTEDYTNERKVRLDEVELPQYWMVKQML